LPLGPPEWHTATDNQPNDFCPMRQFCPIRQATVSNYYRIYQEASFGNSENIAIACGYKEKQCVYAFCIDTYGAYFFELKECHG
jgi:hypothetical protein